MPAALRDVSHVTGVELDPVTARIVKLLQPHARIINEDFARAELTAAFRSRDRQPALLRPNRAQRPCLPRRSACACTTISSRSRFESPEARRDSPRSSRRPARWTRRMRRAREHIAAIGRPRSAQSACQRAASGPMPAQTSSSTSCSSASAKDGEPAGDNAWLDLAEVRAATEDEGAIRVNRYFADHPEMVLGTHALDLGPVRRDLYLPAACRDGSRRRRSPPRSSPSGMRL